ncbi:MAG: Protein of unknown function (DUF1587)/Protein of unknown function (DUF1592)/Protein of unknown [Verrucomicrobiales bacterium]|nr:Protein of unknown function (DUF1587)/Protein of unknown function (DUF1592)/Protein of unknown [Verrucomicrobiales bacterium]
MRVELLGWKSARQAARSLTGLEVLRCVAALFFFALIHSAVAEFSQTELQQHFTTEVRPFVEDYCIKCHDKETRKGELDLSAYNSLGMVVKDYSHWDLVLERLRNGDMPPAKSKQQPSLEIRKKVIAWIQTIREREALRNAGDPGLIPARRLSNAEYDYTIHDLTGVDIRPTRTFPVDPANQAGFDNSGESLAMSPALVKKYLQAAREVSEHLVIKPDGFSFAPHPVVAETDRDKWAVFRIVDFYRSQPTDYAEYFLAAWRYQYRTFFTNTNESLAQEAVRAKLSPKYLALIWLTLTERQEEVGPIAKLQAMWRQLPKAGGGSLDDVRTACSEMRDYVGRVRERIVPEVKNLKAQLIQDGSQTLVMWKNRQMAANRRRFNPDALKSSSSVVTNAIVEASPTETKKTNSVAGAKGKGKNGHVQAQTPDVVKKGGFALPPAIVTTVSSATSKMAASQKKGNDPDLIVPDEPEERTRYESAFARFANIFPDAFYITERARVFLDAEKEKENAGRLLSAGLHSMTGYFRDDQPLYDLILDEAGQKELDRLWLEFDFVAAVPQRMHTSFLWSERTDSIFMRDAEFDPYRPEDKSVLNQEKIRSLAELYLAKAKRNNASELVQAAIREHFSLVASNILRVEEQRVAAEPSHLNALEAFAQRAYRRPLSEGERQELRKFYRSSREENGLDHEEAMRDCIVRVLMSPHFSFRMDLVEAAGQRTSVAGSTNQQKSSQAEYSSQPLSDYALASRLSYFLWSSLPDDELLAHAGAGDLHRPEVLHQQVQRMLKDGRIRNLATEFAGNWLDFRRFEEHNSVDRERFPAFNNQLRRSMFEEPIRFCMDVIQADRPVLDFLYSDDTFVNAPLARHYGIADFPTNSDTWVRVEHAGQFGRGGLLPMAVFLTANSPGLRTSPVKRGNWVVKRILGERIPPPPAIVPELPKDEKSMGTLTLRDALAKHRQNEACAGCHARFDSFGLVFEAFGPIGERREKDLGGRPVDIRAEFPGGTEGAGLEGLRQYIRTSRQEDFLDNLCRKLLAYGLGRSLIISDDLLVKEMRSNLAADNYRFSGLIERIATSSQFLNKRAPQAVAKR